MTDSKIKLTTAEVLKELTAAPTAVPSPEQLHVLRFGELNTFDALLSRMPALISLFAARTLLLETTSRNNRIEGLLKLAPRMAEADFFVLLGDEWSNCVYIFEYREQLRELLTGRAFPIRALMTAEESEIYDRLPAKVTCYRGAAPERIEGICWSLNRDVANGFPFTYRYDQSDVPMFAVGVVAKADIVAVKLGRDEEEIVSFSVRAITTQPADSVAAEKFLASGDRGNTLHEKAATLGRYLPFVDDVMESPALGGFLLSNMIESAVLLVSALRRAVGDSDLAEQLEQIEEVLDEADLDGLADGPNPELILEICNFTPR